MIWTAQTLWMRLLLLAIAAGVTAHVGKIPAFEAAEAPQPDPSSVGAARGNRVAACVSPSLSAL